ncbi:MAG: adenosine deaminase [Actinomycetota bacterium]
MVTSMPIDLVRALPKAELHVHLEGTVDAATVLALAERHGVRPPADNEAGIDEWYRFDGFPMFLERYFAVLALLREPDDFTLIAERYLEQASAQGVVHVEFHVSATGHILEGGKAWAPIHDGIVEGCRRAEQRLGISWGLIPDISPHLPAAECRRAINEVLTHDLDHILAIGMGGPADTWATDDFAAIYADARALGVPGVAHAAEHGGPDEVVWAIEQFQATRIQHGIGVMTEPDAVALLVDNRIPCDVCPGSNLALAAVPSAEAHPLRAMIERGITVTLGSDDPPMFQTSLLDEYRRAWDWCDLDTNGVATLAGNSIEASLAPAHRKAEWLAALNAVDLSRSE